MLGPLIILVFTILYTLIGVVAAGVTRRYLSPHDRIELDDMLIVFIMIWPVFLITKPLTVIYRWIAGRD
jgi:hypothetical protein